MAWWTIKFMTLICKKVKLKKKKKSKFQNAVIIFFMRFVHKKPYCKYGKVANSRK